MNEVSRISYVIPCYNEEESIPEFYRRVAEVAAKLSGREFEFLFVNDGSLDGTRKILDDLAAQDSRVKILHLARNRGHQIAVTAGLDYCTGDMIVMIDADLQDPPEIVEQMLKKMEEGCDIVHGQRCRRIGDTLFKSWTAKIFYLFFKRLVTDRIVENSGDCRAVNRRVLRAIQGFREPHRFLRGLFAELGFRQCIVQYDRNPRFSGKSKYPLHRMCRLAVNGILSSSTMPIRLITGLGLFLWGLALLYLARALYQHFVAHTTVPGWTSIIILLLVFSGLNLFCLAILGAYVSRVYEQGQRRPLYWVEAVRNIDPEGISSVHCREQDLNRRILSEK